MRLLHNSALIFRLKNVCIVLAGTMPVYAEANRERSEAQKMAERHARNEVNIGLRMTAFYEFIAAYRLASILPV